MIITVSGLAGAGKDTLADVLVTKYDFKKISLADSLREICSEVFNIPMSDFLDRDKKDSPMTNVLIPKTSEVFELIDKANFKAGNNHKPVSLPSDIQNVELMTPRDVLKWAGTEVIRKYCGNDIWIKIAVQQASKLDQHCIISDVRFQNERDYFKGKSIMVLIKRSNFPVIDPSENTGQDSEYDVIVSNDETLESFKASVDLWFSLQRRMYAYGTK
jgi:hypothetical protein